MCMNTHHWLNQAAAVAEGYLAKRIMVHCVVLILINMMVVKVRTNCNNDGKSICAGMHMLCLLLAVTVVAFIVQFIVNVTMIATMILLIIIILVRVIETATVIEIVVIITMVMIVVLKVLGY